MENGRTDNTTTHKRHMLLVEEIFYRVEVRLVVERIVRGQ